MLKTMSKKMIERKTDATFDATVRDHYKITIKDSTRRRLRIQVGDIITVTITRVSKEPDITVP